MLSDCLRRFCFEKVLSNLTASLSFFGILTCSVFVIYAQTEQPNAPEYIRYSAPEMFKTIHFQVSGSDELD